MSYSTGMTWTIIIALGVGTFLLRFSFLGIMGRRAFPEWLQRHLRYTAVGVLPGLAIPIVLSRGADGSLNPVSLAAAAGTVLVGVATRNTLAGILGGGLTLFLLPYLIG